MVAVANLGCPTAALSEVRTLCATARSAPAWASVTVVARTLVGCATSMFGAWATLTDCGVSTFNSFDRG